MKKNTCRLLLTSLMCALLFFLLSMEAGAVSQQDAVNWLREQNGVGYNLPNDNRGYQCSDFVSAYMNWLVDGDPRSMRYRVCNANYYPNLAREDSARWEVIANYPDLVPQPGDIFVSDDGLPISGVNYGHTGCVISSTRNTATVIDQDGSHNTLPAKIHNINWGGKGYSATCYIRYKGFSEAGQSSVSLSNGTYLLEPAVGSGNKCLGLADGYNSIWGNAAIRTKTGAADQAIQVIRDGDGYYILRNKSTGLDLDVVDFGSTNGTNVQFYRPSDNTAQRWRLEDAGDGYVYIIPKCNNLSLDVSGGKKDDGTNVQLWGEKGRNQKWRFVSFSGEVAGTPWNNATLTSVTDGVYALETALKAGMRLDIDGGSSENGANVQIYESNSTDAQKFRFTRTSDGYYTIANVGSGKYLDVTQGRNVNGTNVQQWENNYGDAQKWGLVNAGDGYYYLVCKRNGLCLDVNDYKSVNGTNVLVWTSNVLLNNDTKNQRWKLISLESPPSTAQPTQRPAQSTQRPALAPSNAQTIPTTSSTTQNPSIDDAQRPTGCIIFFDGNGGTGTCDAQIVTTGRSFTLPGNNAYTRPGYRQEGWLDRPDGLNIYSGEQIARGDTTYYAHWIPEASVTAFNDVLPTDYFAEAVAWAVSNNITMGTSSTTFSPHTNCTVEQIATFIWRAAGSPTSSAACPFANVTRSSPYYTALCWCSENNILGAESVSSSANCTRSMVALYLWRVAGREEVAVSSVFRDIPNTAECAKAISWAAANNITSGTSTSTFSPDVICSRGQIVTFLYRASNVVHASSAVWLKDLETFVGDGWDVNDNTKDNVGTMHQAIFGLDGCLAYPDKNVYLLNGRYSAISGTLFQTYEDRSEDSETTLNIYGDGNMLYTATVTAGVQPIDFRVDLTGINQLTITLQRASGSLYDHCAAIGECRLWE